MPPKNGSNFDLVSDAVRGLEDGPFELPVYRSWALTHLGPPLDPDIFDEREVVRSAVGMLAGAGRVFAIEPSVVARLHDSSDAANADLDAYFRFALAAQRKRLEAFLREISLDGPATKRLGGVKRGIARLTAELTELSRQRADIETRVEQKMERLLAKRRRRDRIVLLLLANVTTDDPLRRQWAELHREEYRRIEEGTTRIFLKLLDLYDEEHRLEHHVEVEQSVRALLQDTTEGLQALGVTSQRTSPVISPIPVASFVGEEGMEPERHKRPRNERPDTSPPGEVREEEPASSEDDIDLSLRLLREVASSTPRIRVLIPMKVDRISEYFTSLWRELFTQLHYRGEIIFTDMTALSRTSDYEIPIIVPRKMNTHRNIWEPRRFTNVINLPAASPQLMINRLTHHQSSNEAANAGAPTPAPLPVR